MTPTLHVVHESRPTEGGGGGGVGGGWALFYEIKKLRCFEEKLVSYLCITGGKDGGLGGMPYKNDDL